MQSATATNWATRYSARRDLRVHPNLDTTPPVHFNVLDPITRQSYRIGELERTLLLSLNGEQTLAQVLQRLRRDKQYESLGEQQLLTIVEQLHRNGLVRPLRSASGARTGRVLGAGTTRAQAWLAGFVSWQLRGLQPDEWLSRIGPRLDALFSRQAVLVWLSLALMTCLAVLLEFPRLTSQANAWQWILHPIQGSTLFVVFLLTRGLHELGHAVVCKRHGARCPDIGLFIVLGAPCVYCDVSESWQLPSRWQRAAVAAAGMYVELIVATLAAWVWMLTVDGPVNTTALQTMFVCSVSTFLINANPLMRFDGYYILSDILDESNLRGRADGIAEARLYRCILGGSSLGQLAGSQECESNPTYGHLLCLFSWLGWFYRAGLSLAIAGVLVAIYDSWNLAWVGRALAVMILISWWGVPSVKLAVNLIQVARRGKKRLRLALAATIFFGFIGFLPVPYRQFASGWIQPENVRGVYAPATGILESTAELPSSGSFITKDTELFALHDVDAIWNAIRARGFSDRAKKEWESHQLAHSKDIEASMLAAVSAEKRFHEARTELQHRKLKAPCDGRLLVMPASQPKSSETVKTDVVQCSWGSKTQVGRLVPSGTLLATVCGTEMTAIVPLNDSQLEWIASGSEVRLRCAERLGTVYKCKVRSVIPLEEVNATWRLMNGDLTESAANSAVNNSGRKNSAAVYAAQIQLPPAAMGSVGAKVDAVFVAPSQTVASLAYRWLKQNLRWLAD